MTEQETLATLNAIFCDIFDDDGIQITVETTAKDIPEWDSFNHINIIVASEMKFGVKFRTSEIEGLGNVGEFVRLITERSA
jgi:acyl carrier protein